MIGYAYPKPNTIAKCPICKLYISQHKIGTLRYHFKLFLTDLLTMPDSMIKKKLENLKDD